MIAKRCTYEDIIEKKLKFSKIEKKLAD